jgi:hypothetical protein
MKTSKSALKLNEFLLGRRLHPNEFKNHVDLSQDAEAVSIFLQAQGGSYTPFITALSVYQNPSLEQSADARLDEVQLLLACRNELSMLPIDEVSAESIHVFADLLTNKDRSIDYPSAVGVVASLYIRADDLNKDDSKKIKQACSDAFNDFRVAGIITPDIEKSLDKRLSRETSIGMVNDLGLAKSSFQSLKNWNQPEMAR